MLSRSFARNEFQLNQLTHKQLALQVDFAALTQVNQIKPVHYLINYETDNRPSRRENCHPF